MCPARPVGAHSVFQGVAVVASCSGLWELGVLGSCLLRAKAGGCLEVENTGLGSNLSYKFLAV